MYTILLRKRPNKLGPICFLTSIIIIGLLFLFPFYLWEIHTGATIKLTMTSVISVLYVAIFPSVLAFLFWNRAVEMIGATKAGIFIHLMPVFGAIMAYIFLGERLRSYHIAGICLIFSGIYLTTIHKMKLLKNGNLCSSSSRRSRTLSGGRRSASGGSTTGIYRIFRGLKFEPVEAKRRSRSSGTQKSGIKCRFARVSKQKYKLPE